jgi:gas vesicle protein
LEVENKDLRDIVEILRKAVSLCEKVFKNKSEKINCLGEENKELRRVVKEQGNDIQELKRIVKEQGEENKELKRIVKEQIEKSK